MKILFKILLYLLAFMFFLLIFLPKENIYYSLENELEKQGLIISDENIKDKLFGLEIQAADVYYKDMYVANVNKLNITSFLFYNSIEINGMRFSKGFSNMVPTPIENLKLTHSVISSDKAKISGRSIYGDIEGFIDLKNKKILLNLNATNEMKSKYSNIIGMMKLKDGRYIYEYNY